MCREQEEAAASLHHSASPGRVYRKQTGVTTVDGFHTDTSCLYIRCRFVSFWLYLLTFCFPAETNKLNRLSIYRR